MAFSSWWWNCCQRDQFTIWYGTDITGDERCTPFVWMAPMEKSETPLCVQYIESWIHVHNLRKRCMWSIILIVIESCIQFASDSIATNVHPIEYLHTTTNLVRIVVMMMMTMVNVVGWHKMTSKTVNPTYLWHKIWTIEARSGWIDTW